LNKKNEISHRAKAIRKAKELVDENFDFKWFSFKDYRF
jgi:hypothetical protein